ncbi:MAG: hypothetical protein ACFHWX_03270 [Bacteroidota bacterium]
MSFGGPIDSMINANKHNLKLLGKRKSLKEIQGEYNSSAKTPLKTEALHGEKLAKFHQKLDSQKRADRRRFILIVGLTLIIALFLLIWVASADYSSLIDLIE